MTTTTTAATTELATALRHTPPTLPSHYGYDEQGSQLYAQIMRLADYYLPAAESAILADHAAAILTTAHPTGLLDLGAGTAEKTEYFLQHAHHPLEVTLLDVDPTIIAAAAQRLRASYPHHTVTCEQALFHQAHTSPDAPTLVTFLGSTIGNLARDDRAQLLTAIAHQSHPQDTLLITADLHDDPERITAAYTCGYSSTDDVRTRFALNRLHAINTTWNADFSAENYTPGAYYDTATHDVIAYLESTRDHDIRVDDINLTIHLAQGERIIRDRMHKFTIPELETELHDAGWDITGEWVNTTFGYGALTAQHSRNVGV